MKIDLKRDRKLLGLPQSADNIFGIAKIFTAVMVTVALAYFAGTMAGFWREFIRHGRMEKLQALIDTTDYTQLTNDQFQSLMREIQNSAPQATNGNLLLAHFYSRAANYRPDREMLLRAAEFELEQFIQRKKILSYHPFLELAGVKNELGDSKSAVEIINKMEKDFPAEIMKSSSVNNAKAYFLVCAAAKEPQYVQEAFEIMKTKVMSKPQNWLVGAYLDTLAECYYTLGDNEKALGIQRRALALTNSALWDVLEHYRKYQREVREE